MPSHLIHSLHRQPRVYVSPAGRKVRVLLINVKSPEYPLITAPLAIITLGGYLKRKFQDQVDVQYLDLQIDDPTKAKKTIEVWMPHIVGISVKVGGAQELRQLLPLCLEMQPKPLIVLGNVVPTYAAPEILEDFPQVSCCIGRGELTLASLVQQVADSDNKVEYARIPSCSYIKEGNVVETAGMPFDLSDLGTPDWETLFARYKPEQYQEIWVEASRGCPHKKGGIGCNFCAILPAAGSRDWHSRPLPDVFKEISQLSSFGVRHVRFADEEFMAGQTYNALLFANSLNDLRDELGPLMPTFDFAIRVDDVHKRGRQSNQIQTHAINGISHNWSDNDLRRLALISFKKAGLVQVYLGLESGSPSQLKRMYKAVTPQDNENALRILREIGLQVAAGWIMIDPLMVGLDDLKDNVSFIKRNQLIPTKPQDSFVTNPISRMRALAGSPLIQQLNQKHLLGERMFNLVEYRFSYIDPVIRAIAMFLEQWEQPEKSIIYAVKNIVALAILRKQVDSDFDKLTKFLFQIKALDLKFLIFLIKEAEGAELSEFVSRVSNNMGQFVRSREKLIRTLTVAFHNREIRDPAGTLAAALFANPLQI